MWDVSALLVSVSTTEASERPPSDAPRAEPAPSSSEPPGHRNDQTLPPEAEADSSSPAHSSKLRGLASSLIELGLCAGSVAFCRLEALAHGVLGLASWALAAAGRARSAKNTAQAYILDRCADLYRNLMRKVQYIVNIWLVCTTALFCIPIVSIGAILALMASAAVHYLMSGHSFQHADILRAPAVEPRSTVPRRFRVPAPSSFSSISNLVSGAASTARTVHMEAASTSGQPTCSTFTPPGLASCSEDEDSMSSPRLRTHSMLCLVLDDEEFLADLLEGLPGVDRTAPVICSALQRANECAARTKQLWLASE